MGPPSIEGYYDEALATPGLLAEVAAGEREGCDGYVIACFGDPGLYAARELARGPVIGIAEAAMHAASVLAPGFSVVRSSPKKPATASRPSKRTVSGGMLKRTSSPNSSMTAAASARACASM